MRLMLGINEVPNLLIEVEEECSCSHFEFWVVNGCWNGSYRDGFVTIWHPSNPWTSLEKVDILTDNQNRLRGDYNDVFVNFENKDYIAPNPKKLELPASWDDDIPF